MLSINGICIKLMKMTKKPANESQQQVTFDKTISENSWFFQQDQGMTR